MNAEVYFRVSRSQKKYKIKHEYRCGSDLYALQVKRLKGIE